MTADPLTEADVAAFQADVARLRETLDGVLLGQPQVVEGLVLALLARGHVLLEGAPGLGKTQLVKAVARALDQPLGRVQCTPDLMPADIIGSEVLLGAAGDAQARLEFRPGPVFASLLLVDEINRATPRCQSALLEAMQEAQVTVAGEHHPLPQPFWVIATQNPVEFEGTYPLPEAQLDRFAVKLTVATPPASALATIARRTLDGEPALAVTPRIQADRLGALMRQPAEVVLAEAVLEAAADLICATQPRASDAAIAARERLRFGASPRALQTLLRLARVRALSLGRVHVDLDDIQACAPPVLRHRLMLRYDGGIEELDADAVLALIVDEWRHRH